MFKLSIHRTCNLQLVLLIMAPDESLNRNGNNLIYKCVDIFKDRKRYYYFQSKEMHFLMS